MQHVGKSFLSYLYTVLVKSGTFLVSQLHRWGIKLPKLPKLSNLPKLLKLLELPKLLKLSKLPKLLKLPKL